MNQKCKSCEFARYTEHIEKIGCAYWSAKYFDDNPNTTDENRNTDMVNAGINEVWIGWVYLARRPERKENHDLRLGEGMMTNFCVITDENIKCNKFTSR